LEGKKIGKKIGRQKNWKAKKLEGKKIGRQKNWKVKKLEGKKMIGVK